MKFSQNLKFKYLLKRKYAVNPEYFYYFNKANYMWGTVYYIFKPSCLEKSIFNINTKKTV